MPEPLLSVCNLEAGYGDIQVLWGIDIDVSAGSVVSIVGSNGAGKDDPSPRLSRAWSPLNADRSLSKERK